MAGQTEKKALTVRFHRNGMFVIEDASGALHVLEPQETLRDTAKYIWREESLAPLRVDEDESSFKDHKEVKFIKLKDRKEERLRGTNWDDDPYFDE